MSPLCLRHVLILAITGSAAADNLSIITSWSNLTKNVVPPPINTTITPKCWYGHVAGRQCFDNVKNSNSTSGLPGPQGLRYEDVAGLGNQIRDVAYGSPYTANDPAVLVVFAGQDDDCEGIGYGLLGEMGVWFQHTNVTTTTVVLMEDVARTVDGGHAGNGSWTDATQQDSLMHCGSDGGLMNILANTSHPLYNSDLYKSRNYTWKNLLLDIENNALAMATKKRVPFKQRYDERRHPHATARLGHSERTPRNPRNPCHRRCRRRYRRRLHAVQARPAVLGRIVWDPAQSLVIGDTGHVTSDARKAALRNGADQPSWLFHEANATSPQCEMVDLRAYGSAKIRVLYLDNTESIAIMAEDIARTLDGGRISDGGSTAASRAGSLLACGTNGGQRDIMVNTSNPKYNYTTNGVILMLLHSTST